MRALIFIMVFGAIISSCKMDKSVSGFIASHENSPGFKSFSISSNALSIREAETDMELKETLNDIKSIQLLTYSNEDRPSNEMILFNQELLEIIKGESYESLMEVIDNGKSFRLTAKKSGGFFREIVLFGSNEDSFFVGRISGELEEEKGLKLLQAIDFSQITKGLPKL